MRGCACRCWRAGEGFEFATPPIRLHVTWRNDGDEKQRVVHAFVNRSRQQIVAFEGPLITPDGRLVAEIVADQSWQTFDEQVHPSFDVARWIFIVKMSVTNENIVGRGHKLLYRRGE